MSWRERYPIWLGALGLILAACSSAPTTDATTTSTTTASTSTTVATTTTATPGPTSLPRRSTGSNFWELTPDVAYLHDASVLPMTVRFESPGWFLIHSGDRIILFAHATEGQVGGSGGGGDTEAGVGVHFTFLPQENPDQLTAFFLEHAEVVDSTAPQETTFGGREALTFDVLIGSRDGIPRPTGPFPWTGFALAEEIMADGQPAQNWLVGCAWNRVWIVGLEGASLVVHAGDASGTPDDIATLAASETAIQELLDAVKIGTPDA